MKDHRVLSGMRPTGRMHLGHYQCVLKNWIELQNEYDSYYFVADWHAFTTHYSDNLDLENNVSDMVVDWLAAALIQTLLLFLYNLRYLSMPNYICCYQ